MISARIALDDVDGAFEALRKGSVARQVIVFDRSRPEDADGRADRLYAPRSGTADRRQAGHEAPDARID